jgi:hypothetical protein
MVSNFAVFKDAALQLTAREAIRLDEPRALPDLVSVNYARATSAARVLL